LEWKKSSDRRAKPRFVRAGELPMKTCGDNFPMKAQPSPNETVNLLKWRLPAH